MHVQRWALGRCYADVYASTLPLFANPMLLALDRCLRRHASVNCVASHQFAAVLGHVPPASAVLGLALT
eukprot:231611-Pelagomonas_calceolata.AAC.1